MRQAQFLDAAPVDEARRRWHAALDLTALSDEEVAVGSAWHRVASDAIRAPGDVPMFDRSNVDGFAVHAEDTFGASEGEPVTLDVVGAAIGAGHSPTDAVAPGQATVIATGGVLPRGADAVVMVEDTEFEGGVVRISKPVAPGAMVSFAGSDVARGEVVVRAGTRLTARETGTLAACGIGVVRCRRRVRVAVISTGDEIVAPGVPLAPGQVHDANATLLAHTVEELGGEAYVLGIAPDDEASIRALLEGARGEFDVTLISGGTSKGEGDLSYGVLAEMAEICVHGVALKPGKPLCLAAWDRKPVAVLPGFPTSAIFTFHAFVAPVLRRLMGLGEDARATRTARLARHQGSARGRAEFTLVNLVHGRDGLVAFPLGKGSGSVTTFARADGFFEIPANAEYADEGEMVEVTLLGSDLEPADLVIVGSHCTGLDTILERVLETIGSVKVLSVGSRGGIAAAEEGACDLAPVHLFDPESDTWNETFAPEGVRLLRGYGRRQGIVCRPEDAARFAEGTIQDVVRAARSDGALRFANRNPASGTRVLVDALFEDGARPPGWGTAYRSHTAVAAAIAQGRADYGVCVKQAAEAAGLAWRHWRDEQYDFLVVDHRWSSPGVIAFRKALADPKVRAALEAQGFAL